jgi:hypothetical protein
MLLPKQCSFKANFQHCKLPPSEVISILTKNGEYMIGVICDTHKNEIRKRIKTLQTRGLIPQGKINFQDITMVATSCMKRDTCSM